jgi:hypothetical protein
MRMDVESLAVGKISEIVARCPHLKAYITTSDKTPFTDGHIDIYSGPKQNKDAWMGRVPVQVKGRTGRAKMNSTPSYPIERTDLLAYQKDSGVLFLVVLIDPKGKPAVPYYALLSPFKIQAILEKMKVEQLSVSVPLKRLPSDSRLLEPIVALALRTRDQRLSLGFDPTLFAGARSFTIHTASELKLDAPIFLEPGSADFSFVIHTAGGLSIPVGGELQISPPDYVERRVDLRASSGGVTYEGADVKRIDPQRVQAEFAPSLTLVFQHELDKQSVSVSMSYTKGLAERLKAIEFLLGVVDTSSMELNDTTARFAPTKNPDVSELRAHARALRRLDELLRTVGVEPDSLDLVDLDQIDEIELRALAALYQSLVDGKEIAVKGAQPSRVYQKVAQWELMILISRGKAQGRWRLIDPFSPEFRSQFRWSADGDDHPNPIPVTAYDVVEQENMASVLNLRLDSIVAAYEAIADFSSTLGLANQRVLGLLLAADVSELRRGEFLDAASRLNDWVIGSEGEKPHHLVNRWQIAMRRGTLSTKERSEVRALHRRVAKEGSRDADYVELACLLLLGDIEGVDDLIDQLPDERAEQFRRWPIWNLRSNNS